MITPKRKDIGLSICGPLGGFTQLLVYVYCPYKCTLYIQRCFLLVLMLDGCIRFPSDDSELYLANDINIPLKVILNVISKSQSHLKPLYCFRSFLSLDEDLEALPVLYTFSVVLASTLNTSHTGRWEFA